MVVCMPASLSDAYAQQQKMSLWSRGKHWKLLQRNVRWDETMLSSSTEGCLQSSKWNPGIEVHHSATRDDWATAVFSNLPLCHSRDIFGRWLPAFAGYCLNAHTLCSWLCPRKDMRRRPNNQLNFSIYRPIGTEPKLICIKNLDSPPTSLRLQDLQLWKESWE